MESKEENKKSEPINGITYGEVLKRYYKLEDPKSPGEERKLNIRGFKLLHAKSNNFDILKQVVKHITLDKIAPASKEFEAFEKAHRDIHTKYSLDASGNPKMRVSTDQNGNSVNVYDIRGREEEVAKAAMELDKKNQKLILARQAELVKYEEYLNQVCDKPLDFMYVASNDVNDDIEEEAYQAIKWMIKS